MLGLNSMTVGMLPDMESSVNIARNEVQCAAFLLFAHTLVFWVVVVMRVDVILTDSQIQVIF